MGRLSQAAARHRLLAVGVACYLLGCAAVLGGWRYGQAAHEAAAIEAYGRTIAQDVAWLAVEPLMRQDRVALGVAADRMAERPQVRAITVYTIDRAPFVSVGETVQPGSPAFRAPIRVQDSVVGHVTVTLNQAAFASSLARLLGSSWWWLAAGLLLAGAGGHVAGRRLSPPSVPAPPEPAPPEKAPAETATPATSPAAEEASPAEADGGPYLLVANLFARTGQSPADREQALRRGVAVAEAVAQQAKGEATALADVGIAVRFPGDEQPDAAHAAVRDALLLRAVLGQLGLPPFRYALEQVPKTATDPTEGVTAMASLAADGQLLLGAVAAGCLDRPQRLLMAAVDSPAAMVLPPSARPSQVVHGLAEGEAALAEQAAAIAAAASLQSVDAAPPD